MSGESKHAVSPDGALAEIRNDSPNPIKVVDNRKRVKAWRRKNPERYRAYMKAFMRKKRAQA